MFGKKTDIIEDTSNKDKDISNDDNILNTENIFEDFQNDSDLQNEIENTEKQIQKDYLFYLKLVWKIFKNINIILFIVLIIWFAYVYIQKDKSWLLDNNSTIQVFCPILVWDVVLKEWTCSPLTSSINLYKNNLKNQKDVILFKTFNTIKELYVLEDIISSDKMSFVLDKTQNKQNPFFTLNEFNNIKNTFTWIDKSQIQCFDIKISNNHFSANCSAYSAYWEPWITWFNWSKWASDTVSWTSISIASSFLNYLELDKNITLENKQKTFSKEDIIWWSYTSKTDFNVDFIYKTDILSF